VRRGHHRQHRTATLLVDGANLVVNPALYPHVAYDPLKDFDPVTIAVTAPAILTVHPSVPAKTVKDLVALIKASPGKYSYASPGTGTPPHLVGTAGQGRHAARPRSHDEIAIARAA
jgi:tripartite-type tricarboxylate transporter receptor subunit TctC